jgi:hypothetical protein
MIADINTIISRYSRSDSLIIENKKSIPNKFIINDDKNKKNNFKTTIVFMNITDDRIINFSQIRYWLQEHCQKWVLFRNSQQIYIIFSIKSYSRIDSITRSLKISLINTNKKYDFNNVIKSKKILSYKNLKNVLNKYFFTSNDDINFDNMELNGYTKKYIQSILNNNSFENENIIVCSSCSKEFKTIFNKNRHEKTCKEKIKTTNEYTDNNKIKNSEYCSLKNEITDVKNEISSIKCLFEKLSENKIDSSIIQINNNYKSKKDKLNRCLTEMMDLDTFIEKYNNDDKYQLTKDESLILLDKSNTLSVNDFADELYEYLKNKYYLMLKELTGKDHKYYDAIMPFISNDTNLRSHYELTKTEGWILVKDKNKIKNILNIADNQIFKHHNRPIYYTKHGKKNVINILLRKSDYCEIESKLNKITETNNNSIAV